MPQSGSHCDKRIPTKGPVAQLVSSTWLIIRGSLVQAQAGPQKNHPVFWMIFLWFFRTHTLEKCILTRWKWRDSNPRPNKEPICFLHAYLGLRFRAIARPKPPTIALSAKSHSCIAAYKNQPWYFRTAWSYQPLGIGLERCLGSAPCAETRRIYYTSITQRELQYCCQL